MYSGDIRIEGTFMTEFTWVTQLFLAKLLAYVCRWYAVTFVVMYLVLAIDFDACFDFVCLFSNNKERHASFYPRLPGVMLS